MMLTFSFTALQDNTGNIVEIVHNGNIPPQLALHIIQQIVIAEAVRKAQNDGSKPVEQEVKQ